MTNTTPPADSSAMPKPLSTEFLAACREYAEVMADARPDEDFDDEDAEYDDDDDSWFNDPDMGAR